MELYIGIGVTVIVLLFIFIIYNSLVKLNNRVKEAFATMDVYLKKRWDLIPNIVDTVKGYASHEKEVIDSITSSREKLLGANSASEMAEANQELTSALNNLLVIVENYPDLKANQNFMELQAQLEGTENRIATERMKYNEAAKAFNTGIRRFPDNIVASIFGFERKGYFEAQAGAETAPKVEF